ncbi:VOC family protein [uncultured Ruminococcus sp.]|uniref:VOC family protein n=1 Tax=uncultured Ruminococcus sp. TaxID=165186 RepID=UPI0025F2A2F7|nr:VOC family protein [uncultured Ruminococcus sp.]
MKIEHVALYVHDLEAARDFFVKYLGASSNSGYHNKTTDFRSYFLSFDDGARLEIMTRPALESCENAVVRTGYIHIAFSLGSKEKVDELTARLKADGYKVLSGPRTTGDGYYESCIIGIEGNQIELTI